jgi:hypothetical protein
MTALADSVRDRVARREWITRAEIDALAATDDLDAWSAVHDALSQTHCRVHPVPDPMERWSFIRKYLLRCIQQNPPSNHVHSGYEAAWELAGWIKSWALGLPGSRQALEVAEHDLAAAWKTGDDGVRDRLVNGTLEHALEKACVRPFFAHWENDPSLNEAWQPAMSWATTRGEPAV